MIGEIIEGTGVLLTCASWAGLVREAFCGSRRWGWACLLVPLVAVVFAVRHWERAWRPGLALLGGVGLIALGGLAGPPPA